MIIKLLTLSMSMRCPLLLSAGLSVSSSSSGTRSHSSATSHTTLTNNLLFILVMPLLPKDIVKDYVDDGSSLERVNQRKVKAKIAIVEPNSEWPQRFLSTKARIEAALGSTALGVHHAGSTSVPGLPAKDIIDIDLVVKDIEDEVTYVEPLERSGFVFLFREPAWHQHRFFVDEGDRPRAYPINLHVFGPDCPEVERHRIFRDWLVETPEDLQLYARVKRECATASEAAGESMQEYTLRKDETIREIRKRAFRALGYIQ